MSTTQVLIAGFGGQGILFAGKFLAYAGLLQGRNVSWLPSYGPEMRGGTANCSVILSDTQVGSPIVGHPDILIAMNLPSLEKYENEVPAGGCIFVDSSLVNRAVKRDDVKVFPIPATSISTEKGYDTLANMILMGHVIAHTHVIPDDMIRPAMQKVVSARHADLLEKNIEALNLGVNYQA